jgi:hypothetical protein
MALEVLFSELREVSPSGGDILAMSSDSLRVRLMRKFGIVCATSAIGPTLTVLPWGIGTNAFASGDSIFVFADNDPAPITDDVWIAARVTGVLPSVCPQDGALAQAIAFSGQAALFAADSVGIGAPMRSYEEFTFGTTTMLGDTYFARRDGTGPMIPIAGPLRSSDGIELIYRDALGAVTAVATDVRQIEVIVRTGSGVLNSVGNAVSDSINAWIHTRN